MGSQSCTCTHPSTYTATTSYGCPSDGTLSGSSCSRNDNYAASVSYSCNAGDALSGSSCNHTNYVAATVTYSVSVFPVTSVRPDAAAS
ncbi:hypothetical protein CR105_26695 [Massilia eurypsychrophila]|uniref:Uncharacterized protein n=1 Tax=Massilia eurypsychrophila TaxID=1485217 RepID=A0A2G8T7F9_9BURK|nr:hypothetical protein [Massilia eurypsychrophila]PIL41997.1 hypothetical protein CR105_26695 [Massilia eurypsychrophila]